MATGTQFAHEFDFALRRRGYFTHHCLVGGDRQALGEHSYNLEDMVLSSVAWQPLGPLEADLRDVALMIHLADRLAPRKPPGRRDGSGLWWSRAMRIRIGVRCVDRWNDPAVKAALINYLRSNSNDAWAFDFVQSEASLSAVEEQQVMSIDVAEVLRRRYPNLNVALFSGGLDSTVGVIDQLQRDPDSQMVLVSVDSSSTVRRRQENLLETLRGEFPSRIRHVPLDLRLRGVNAGPVEQRDRREMSVRTRGLVFLSAGAIVARLSGRNHFSVYENGIGAFNLPLDDSQVMGQANRAVHPRSLAAFGRFATALFGQHLYIVNPYQFVTKGQMCQVLDTNRWRPAIAQTFTCGHPQRIRGERLHHCGACTSCILRRQALRVANLTREDGQEYKDDLMALETVPGASRDEWIKVYQQWLWLEKTLTRAPNDGVAWIALVGKFPELLLTVEELCDTQGLSPDKARLGLLNLLRTYVSEGLALAPMALHVEPYAETPADADVALSRAA